MSVGLLSLRNVSKSYDGQAAVRDLNLTVHKGELLTLLGPSGSGKTTTLMMMAGLTFPDSGRLFLREQDITYMPPQHRNMGMVFQSYALFPHMTVLENVAFPLRARGIDLTTTVAKTRKVLAMTRLSAFEDRLPSQLSGGQQQRVALARAMVFEPPVLLMDEPLGALDKNLRAEMQNEIKEIQRAVGFAIVHVTHDQEEALTMSDRIAVLANGRLRQLDPPRQVYDNPVDTFVAGFLGEANLLKGTIASATTGAVTLRLESGAQITVESARAPKAGEEAVVCIRPERLRYGDFAPPDTNLHEGIVQGVQYHGYSNIYAIRTSAAGVLKMRCASQGGNRQLLVNERVTVFWQPEDGCLLLQ